MDMYTELFLQVELKKDTPEEVISTLSYMLGDEEAGVCDAPFPGTRWDFMLTCSSHYHYPFAHSSLDYVGYLDQFYLFVRCDFKDYDGELKGFLEWIAPWVEDGGSHYQGHHMYEEHNEPTRIKFHNGNVYY